MSEGHPQFEPHDEAHTSPEDYGARRTMLLAAIADTEGTIHASDTKASIALVIHGLILSGVLSLAGSLGADFEGFYRALVIVLLAAIVVVFVTSVFQLLRSVTPTPARVFSGIEGGHNVFFVEARADPITGNIRGVPSVSDVHRALVCLDEGELEEDLVVELMRVSAVRARKVALVGSGLRLLGIEIALAVAFAVSIGLHSL